VTNGLRACKGAVKMDRAIALAVEAQNDAAAFYKLAMHWRDNVGKFPGTKYDEYAKRAAKSYAKTAGDWARYSRQILMELI
jgi:hypothetical protein